MVVPLLIFLLSCLNGFTTAGYHFPIFPQGLFAQGAGDRASSNAVNKKIPKSFWIAVVNASEVAEWPHIVHLKKSNPNWALNLCDNAAKDSFMRENFYGTSLLWAYENINPAVGGAARADIWRYAVLFLKGGVCKFGIFGICFPLCLIVVQFQIHRQTNHSSLFEILVHFCRYRCR